MNADQRLLLAYGIAEYATALDHLNALRTVGERVPYSVLGNLQVALRDLTLQWDRDSHFLPTDTVVREARAHLTEQGPELERLLTEKRTGDDEGRRPDSQGG